MDILREGKNTARPILDLTDSLIKKCGPRTPGSQGSAEAAKALAGIMGEFCDEVSEETFQMYPGSLFNIGRVISLVYILSVLLLSIGGICVYISFILCLMAFVYAFIQYFCYGRLFDRLFRKRPGINVVGTIEPSGEVKRQVIVSGHHDSPYVFNFLARFERLAGIRFLLAMLFYLYITALSFVAVILQNGWQFNGAVLIIALAGLVFLIPLFFFISGKASPGAGDNLNGSSIALHVGKYFAEQKKSGAALLSTRLIILSTDGEEAGQRGAIAYVHRHKQELLDCPTTVLNIDSVYSLKDLSVLLRDRHGFLPLSAQMAGQCAAVASDLEYDLKAVSVPFGSGTDAAAFAKEGIRATTIIGMPASLFAKEYVYHTLRDTVDRIEPEAVAAVYDIAINYIMRSDRAIIE